MYIKVKGKEMWIKIVIFLVLFSTILIEKSFAEINITQCEETITILGDGVFNITATDIFGNTFVKQNADISKGVSFYLHGKIDVVLQNYSKINVSLNNSNSTNNTNLTFVKNTVTLTSYVLSDMRMNLTNPTKGTYFVYLPINFVVEDAIKTAYLQIDEFLYELDISYENNKSKVSTSKRFSFDFKNPTLVIKDFCDQTIMIPLEVTYHHDRPWVEIETDKEAYSVEDTMKINVRTNYDLITIELLEENKTIYQTTEYVTNETKELYLKLNEIIDVEDVTQLTIKVADETYNVYVYNPTNHKCSIKTTEFYEGYNIIEVETDSLKNRLYFDNELICDLNYNKTCTAYLDSNEELELECDYEEFQLSDTKPVTFVNRKHKLTIEVFDATTKEKLQEFDIDILNENTENKDHYSASNPAIYSLKEGLYKIYVSHENYYTLIKNVFLKEDTTLTFYLLPRKEIPQITLRVTKVDIYGEEVSVYGSVKNADVCYVEEGKGEMYLKIASAKIVGNNFKIEFNAKPTLDYKLICKNKYQTIERKLISDFKVKITENEEVEKKEQERFIYFTEILKNIKYSLEQFVDLADFWNGLEEQVKERIKVYFYEQLLNATNELIGLNNYLVNYALYYAELINKSAELKVSLMVPRKDITDLINIKSKLLMLESNIKKINFFLKKYEEEIKEYDFTYLDKFMINESYAYLIAFLNKNIPTKITISNYEPVEQDLEGFRNFIDKLCIIDKTTVKMRYRDFSKYASLYRITCPNSEGILLFNKTQRETLSKEISNDINHTEDFDNYILYKLNSESQFFLSLPQLAFIPKNLEELEYYLKTNKTISGISKFLTTLTGNYINLNAVCDKKCRILASIVALVFISLIGIGSVVIVKRSQRFDYKKYRKSLLNDLQLNKKDKKFNFSLNGLKLFRRNGKNSSKMFKNFEIESIIDTSADAILNNYTSSEDIIATHYNLNVLKDYKKKKSFQLQQEIKEKSRSNLLKDIFKGFVKNFIKSKKIYKTKKDDKGKNKEENENRIIKEIEEKYKEFNKAKKNNDFVKVQKIAYEIIMAIDKCKKYKLNKNDEKKIKTIEMECFNYL